MLTNLTSLYTIYIAHPIISTDSRQTPSGCLFFALRGEKFDGNRFAAQALAGGAAYAIIDDPTVATDSRYLVVENVLATLQQLATYHRRQLAIPVVAITGSNGKTTTKELVQAVLGTTFRTVATQGNLNNHIGVPLTLLAIPADAQLAVVEMGANHQGEIAQLAAIALPTHGLITNVGKAHLEGFGGEEGVRRGKSELYAFLATEGTVFVNLDQPHLAALTDQRGVANVVTYGSTAIANTRVTMQEVAPFVVASFQAAAKRYVVHSHLIGEYNFHNISTAIAVGLHFGVPADRICAAIASYIPQNNRSQIIEKQGNTIILDAYNANPTSVQHALANFGKLVAQRKIAILGDMFELGEASPAEHLAIAQFAASLNLELLVLVGKQYGNIRRPAHTLHFADAAAAKAWLNAQAFEGVHLLIKGSRGMRLETILH